MRIHSDILDSADIRTAAKAADMTLETFGQGGSRSRKSAFTVLASGNSTRNAMSNDFKAATWDQWGVFLANLFQIDPDMHTGANGYSDSNDFHHKTCNRFENYANIDVYSSHGHRWEFVSAYFFECKAADCTAAMRTVIR